MVFTSYYWHDAVLSEPELARARDALSRDDTAERLGPFLVLLSSDRVAARGIALDHFHYAEASGRFGVDNPFSEHRPEVLAAARALLADPPLDRGDEGAEVVGANHASALGAMINLAEPQDARRVAAVISGDATQLVRELALQCAETILEASSAPELTDAVRVVVDDDDASDRDRGDALHLLALAEPDGAMSRAVELLRHPSLRLQASAAWLLAERDPDAYRPLLDRVVSAWPDDAPYPAFEVRQLLD